MYYLVVSIRLDSDLFFCFLSQWRLYSFFMQEKWYCLLATKLLACLKRSIIALWQPLLQASAIKILFFYETQNYLLSFFCFFKCLSQTYLKLSLFFLSIQIWRKNVHLLKIKKKSIFFCIFYICLGKAKIFQIISIS